MKVTCTVSTRALCAECSGALDIRMLCWRTYAGIFCSPEHLIEYHLLDEQSAHRVKDLYFNEQIILPKQRKAKCYPII